MGLVATSFGAIPDPIIDNTLPILAKPSLDHAISTKSPYNIPDVGSVVSTYSNAPKPRTKYRRAGEGTCTTVQVQLVARHGTRNPTKGDLKKFTSTLDKLKSYVPVDPKLAFLSNFQLPWSDTVAGLLTTQGVQDHVDLAKRIKQRYQAILADPKTLQWASTNVSRSIASGQSFIRGMVDEPNVDTAITALKNAIVPKELDADLRPHEACKNYVDAKNTQKYLQQPDTQFKSARYPAIILRLANDYQLKGLDEQDITNLFKLCAFENTIQGKIDGFCSLFRPDEFIMADFAEDLGFNFVKGYEIPINEQLACSLVTTVSNNMDKIVSNAADAAKGIFKFAHAETIAPIITTLGLFKGDRLAGNATDEQILSRAFNGKTFSPFAGNVIFELNKCADNSYNVRVLSDEVPVVVPGCPSEVCPLETFKNALKGKIGCDFDAGVCRNLAPTIGGAATIKTLGPVGAGTNQTSPIGQPYDDEDEE
ncbi:uncharacterized protein SPPG_08762 [Spizellomyces punctatus DAOM BR117]|uniref:Multiple inositol polyphosphate phosphatase 1 n=1 Tax=Spizellomyces punctatus (strain DAOM BR117) TaxID=645134 RepID=A0A0L0H3P3_SPIPD|nr:uncharacterized protein SPPG_08762 [Spizellomyces punctatus DAOM BR117]KNC95822.1 hypothetical protein SPPG_08762 [Spizellomyces punctatus DAOM BR117]|eukprot:XP_016603862.1 hypothetical protein SPPG_08762 [Spizellomyces punctatus DAOM BR117]